MKAFRSLWLPLRFVVPLVLTLGVLAYAVVPLVDTLTQQWFVRDLDIRSRVLGDTLEGPLKDALDRQDDARVNGLLARAVRDERLLALGYCDPDGKLRYSTALFPALSVTRTAACATLSRFLTMK